MGLLKACQIGSWHWQESLSFSTDSNPCLLLYLSFEFSACCDLLNLEMHPDADLHSPPLRHSLSAHLFPLLV